MGNRFATAVRRLWEWDAKADAATKAAWHEFWRLVRLGASEVRACFRVDPALAAFVDRFLFGKHPRAVRLAMVALLPLGNLLAYELLRHGWRIMALSMDRGSALRAVSSVGRDLLLFLAMLPFLIGLALVLRMRRLLARPGEWIERVAIVPDGFGATFRRALALLVFLSVGGEVLGWFTSMTWRSMGPHAGTLSILPFRAGFGRYWIALAPDTADDWLVVREPIAWLCACVDALFWTTLAVFLLVAFRRMIVGVVCWIGILKLQVTLFPWFEYPIVRRRFGVVPRFRDVFKSWFGGIENESVRHLAWMLVHDVPIAIAQLVLSFLMIGWMKKHYDRIGLGLAERWG